MFRNFRPLWLACFLQACGGSSQSASDGLDYATAEEFLLMLNQPLVEAGIDPALYEVTPPPEGTVRLPAAWERIDEVAIVWDSAVVTYYANLARAIAAEAKVRVLVPASDWEAEIRGLLPDIPTDRLLFTIVDNNSLFSRDFGPIPIEVDGKPAFADFFYLPGSFSSGRNRPHDDVTPTLLAQGLGLPVFRPQSQIEGGGLQTNGNGLCVVSRVLMGTQDLPSYLGCTTILKPNMGSLDLTSHVDVTMKFANESTVLLLSGEGLSDRDARTLDNQQSLFERAGLQVVRVPSCGKVIHDSLFEQETGPNHMRSMLNSLIVNNSIIIPDWGNACPKRDEILKIYRTVFPNHSMVTIAPEVDDLAAGAVHCTTVGYRTR